MKNPGFKVEFFIDEDGDIVVRLADPPPGWYLMAHGMTVETALRRLKEAIKAAQRGDKGGAP